MKSASLVLVALLSPVVTQAAADPNAEKAAAALLEERMGQSRPEDLAILRATKGKDVVVVRGSMDHIETVLAAAKIPFTMLDPAAVAAAPLNADQVVMVNCPGVMPVASHKRLERFVRAGGLLYTTDWALKNVIEPAFPNTVRHNGQSTGDHVTAVEVHQAHDDMMTNVLLRNDGKPQWWLEGGSYPIQVVDAERVQVLASSPEMGKRYGSAPVVVRFGWHDGEVIHVVSHFHRQAAAVGPTVAAKQATAKIDGLSAAQAKKMAEALPDNLALNELESSYAFQQMTSNLVVGKARRNQELDRAYGWQNKGQLELEGQALKTGARLRLLERKGEKMRVRDDRGYEGWVDAAELVAR